MTEVQEIYKLVHQDAVILAANQGSRNIKEEVDDIVSVLDIKKDDKILDMCCGLGHHSHELASQGFSVTGLDYAPGMVGRAVVSQLVSKTLSPSTFHLGDARYVPEYANSSFSKVLLLGNSLAFFAPDERVKVLQEIGRLLTTSGKIVLDFANVEYLKKNNSRTWDRVDDKTIVLREQAVGGDAKSLASTITVISHEKGLVSTQLVSEKLFNFEELEALLKHAGFGDIARLERPSRQLHLVAATKSSDFKVGQGIDYPLEVRDVSYGKGGFAARDIQPGEIIHRFSGPIMEYEKIPAEEIIYCIWTWEHFGSTGGLQTVCLTPTKYINHCCDPNCFVTPHREVVAKKPIKKGEELSFIYCFSDYYDYWDPKWTFECQCGAQNCLKMIDGYYDAVTRKKLLPPVTK